MHLFPRSTLTGGAVVRRLYVFAHRLRLSKPVVENGVVSKTKSVCWLILTVCFDRRGDRHGDVKVGVVRHQRLIAVSGPKVAMGVVLSERAVAGKSVEIHGRKAIKAFNGDHLIKYLLRDDLVVWAVYIEGHIGNVRDGSYDVARRPLSK